MSHHDAKPAGRAGTWRIGPYEVPRLGYGAMQLQRHTNDRKTALTLLRRVVELGITHIDTAEFYGGGFVNDVIREVLQSVPDLVVASKVGADPNPGGPVPIRPAQRPEQLRASVEHNLRSLGVEQLPVVNLRRLDVQPTLPAVGDQVVDIEDQLAVMIALRDEGKIGAIGLSAVDLEGLTRALPAGIACVQNAYSLVSRNYEAMLDLCVAEGIAWVPFFPLGGAYFPEWPKVAEHPVVLRVAARLKVDPSQLGLAWLLAHRPNVLLIPGTASLTHLQDNIDAASIVLDAATRAELDAIAPPAPARHQENQK